MRLALRLSNSKYYSKDPKQNEQRFDIIKQYLQMCLEAQTFLLLKDAVTAFGFDDNVRGISYPKGENAWICWDKRNKVRVHLENRKILERKDLLTGKKYYKYAQFIVFDIHDNWKYAEAYIEQTAYRKVGRHEYLRTRT